MDSGFFAQCDIVNVNSSVTVYVTLIDMMFAIALMH